MPESMPAFDFGENWSRFLSRVDEERLQAAVDSFKQFLKVQDLKGRTFLDAGCGSGLFSLAAHRLGARVLSFDFNPKSVRCAEELRRRFAANAEDWTIVTGSLLDATFMAGLGRFDVVYSWGVVHHTGSMWEAIGHLEACVADGGRFWLAIYNDQEVISRNWTRIKSAYVRLPELLKTPYVLVVGGGWGLWNVVKRVVSGIAASALRLATLRSPVEPVACLWNDLFVKPRDRGMHAWYDLVDWIGGYPFEVARPEDVFRRLRDRGFTLEELVTCGGGLGCNEFLFRRIG